MDNEAMNEWIEKSFTKEFPQKYQQKVNMEVKLPHVNKKTQAREQSFFETPFSLCFKTRVQKFVHAKPLVFSLQFLLRRNRNHHFNST